MNKPLAKQGRAFPLRTVLPWMDIDDNELLRLRNEGGTTKAIAMQIGRTQAATDARLARLKAMGRV